MAVSTHRRPAPSIRAHAPGRVNLIGDHTDYTGGLALPMAIDLGTTVSGERSGDKIVLRSDAEAEPAHLPLDVREARLVEPPWARFVAAVVEQVRPAVGFTGEVASSLPLGGGLASSASFTIAVALALGATTEPLALSRLAQEAEHRAIGVPCGIMDQLAITGGVAGHALLLDCQELTVAPVPLPAEVNVLVLDSGEKRRLTGSAYAERRAQCAAAEAEIGPLRRATDADVTRLQDEVLRRRAHHVVTENQRVRDMASALAASDVVAAGELMSASHASLRDDFEVSTDRLDHLVASLAETPGVYGARLTGAGFGGCVVAVARPGAVPWTTPVRAVDGASITVSPR